MNRADITALFLCCKDIVVYKEGRYELCCEVDMFNDHLSYFVREDKKYEYGYYSDFEDAITNFLERINKEENK